MKLMFGEWLPDIPDLDNPGCEDAKNVVPRVRGYGELRDLSAFSGALNAACTGTVWAKDSSGVIYNHAGSASQLLELQGDLTWDNVSKAGNYTGATAWEWTQLGDRLIAVDGALSVPTQYFDLGTSTLYADLSGAPKAKHIAAINNFVIMGNIDDGTAYPSRLAWSGYNNSSLWTPSRATQSDIRDLHGRGGDIQRIVPGRYGVVFQENSIWVMTYAGPPTIFTLAEIERGKGTSAPLSVCWAGNTIYYLGSDGFYRFTDRSEPISSERVSAWFFDTFAPSAITSVRGVVDRHNTLVIWSFKSDSSLAYSDYLLFYNWVSNRWSYGRVNTEVLGDYSSVGITLEGLDAIITDLDSGSVSLDSDSYKGGIISLMAFDTAHKMATFQGDPLMATMETQEFGELGRTTVNNVRPLVDGPNSTITVAAGTRARQDENVTYQPERSLNAIGEANIRTSARYHRFRVKVDGGFESAQGVDIDVRQGGRR